ncbi:glycerophosphodiester phosphodiesterase family protein [Weizmannia sp. CD-2023]|uniref:glycerophosphodiester phosphodiesterase family protein n=1 Tax=Heyndrickxia TaxID=2837504 RepID=UPI002E1AC4C9|nr:glycerophosphodiester phosphodiesterase family protein [Weizmannia sp. CD-2023]MED4313580.1 glycerophosphodiester phosphodiesterase family protein [Heyndrickxia coagulans]MED4323044.1 glycerophosphodiester phosphodiesterase family protein [Weizmannia sp. CD-2023]
MLSVKKYPDTEMTQLDGPLKMNFDEVKTYADGVGPSLNHLSETFVKHAHDNGLSVHVWTVDNQTTGKRNKNCKNGKSTPSSQILRNW